MAESSFTALINVNQVVEGILYLSDGGCFYRDEGDWMAMDWDGDDLPFTLEELEAVETTQAAISLYDSLEATGGTMVLSDL